MGKNGFPQIVFQSVVSSLPPDKPVSRTARKLPLSWLGSCGKNAFLLNRSKSSFSYILLNLRWQGYGYALDFS